MQSPHGAQGSLTGFVYIMISIHNTSLILAPFFLLLEAASLQKGTESKKTVSETHRTQA